MVSTLSVRVLSHAAKQTSDIPAIQQALVHPAMDNGDKLLLQVFLTNPNPTFEQIRALGDLGRKLGMFNY